VLTFSSTDCLDVVENQNPVTQFAKKTGDYSALSHADLCVLALTYALDKAEKVQPSGQEVEVRRPSILVYFFADPL
jgi:rRNA maturation endonuclease Nob1